MTKAYEALLKIADERNVMADDAHYQFMDKTALVKHFSDYDFVFKNLDEMIYSITF